jgi:energy-coupling factor transporter ATP-binding protein EcfA2
VISQILLKSGPFIGGPRLDFNPDSVTVFVGPNNSGKSLVLRELLKIAEEWHVPETQVLDHVYINTPSREYVENLFARRHVVPDDQRAFRVPNLLQGNTTTIPSVNLADFFKKRPAEGITGRVEGILSPLLRIDLLYLDGTSRLSLASPRSMGSLQKSPENHLMALAQSREARTELRRIVHDAFSAYAVIDLTSVKTIQLRLAREYPGEAVELGLHTESVEFHRRAFDINSLGDGVRAFVGLVSAAVCEEFRVLVIDEPEAFLHPPLARRLGTVLTQLAHRRRGNMVVSTHSPDFLYGCIASGLPVNVVRLTWDPPVATAKLFEAARLTELMRQPMIRCAGTLSALFHRGAVVCEADADRVFYDEINNRLLQANRSGAKDTIFLNVNGKDTVSRVVSPLREIGIPAAAVVDLDLIQEGFDSLVNACYIPELVRTSLGHLRSQLKARQGDIKLKETGVGGMSGDDRRSLDKLINDLAEYGLFLVPVGELDRWLSELGIAGKRNWLTRVFEKMKSDPSDEAYVRPGKADVWEFAERIASWIHNSERKGMPSIDD